MNKIPLCIPYIGEDEQKNIIEVLKSGWLAPGEYNNKFENQFKKLLDCEYAISMNSCASALEIALKSNNIKGEVILPSFTFVASANAIINAGAKPVFCDVKVSTRNVSAKYIEPLINPNTEAIMVVHFGGQPCEMDEIMKLCKKHNLLLIEDSAETLGATYKGKQAGSFGIGCFSFFPTKNVTTGEGGMFTCNDESVAIKAKTLIGHGISKTTFERSNIKIPWHRNAIESGYNYRMSNLLASLGYNQMLKLDTMNEKRVKLAERYTTLLKSLDFEIETPYTKIDATHVYQMYTIQVPEEKRDNIVLGLLKNNIGASVHFEPPVHLQDYYKKIYKPQYELINTNYLSKSIVTLPIFPSMKYEEVEFVVNTLKGIWDKC